jgi:signal transduction histidine kinase
MSVINALLMIALITLSGVIVGIIIWRCIFKKRFPLLILLFLILPVGQVFVLYSFRFDTWSLYWVIGAFLGVFAVVSLLVYAMSQEKKIAAEEELKEAQYRMALEKSHYDAVLNRREQLAAIRLDFGKQLEAVTKLVGSGKEDSACEIIDTLKGQISSTSEEPFCAVPVVNAILTEKERTCRASGIDLKIDLNIPERLAVSPMHLCSIFSNILDNAIAACQKAQSADKPVIRLSSMVDGDYLFIKAVNTSDKPDYLPSPGRGYGLRIISDLAKRYGGDFQSSYSDRLFTAVVSLLAVESAVEG